MTKYLILLAQKHEDFRRAELESLAQLENIQADFSDHDPSAPFLIVELKSSDEAERLIRRSILTRSIYEFWASASSLEELYTEVSGHIRSIYGTYKTSSFKFEILSHGGSRPKDKQIEIFEALSQGFEGPIRMKKPKEIFTLMEEYNTNDRCKTKSLKRLFFGRYIASSQRSIVDKYDLKQRPYIGTTSFDAELSLISCNIGKVDKYKLMYDPFAGTGSFLVAAGHYGALTFGSDIDGRQLRGSKKRNIYTNFKYYNILHRLGDLFTCDFTHHPFRSGVKVDSIICDPPYGVREGLKVLGSKDSERSSNYEPVLLDGEYAHLRSDYIPPKKPYPFHLLLQDLLDFSALHLISGARLCCWVPYANEGTQQKLKQFPLHEDLKLIYSCVQEFGKWSRALLVYERRQNNEKGQTCPIEYFEEMAEFREKYFHGFAT